MLEQRVGLYSARSYVKDCTLLMGILEAPVLADIL